MGFASGSSTRSKSQYCIGRTRSTTVVAVSPVLVAVCALSLAAARDQQVRPHLPETLAFLNRQLELLQQATLSAGTTDGLTTGTAALLQYEEHAQSTEEAHVTPAEAVARSAGLWADPNPLPPWEWPRR